MNGRVPVLMSLGSRHLRLLVFLLTALLPAGWAEAADPFLESLLAEPGLLKQAALDQREARDSAAPSPTRRPMARRSAIPASDWLDDDPLEPVNRQAHEFNTFLRQHLLEPVTQVYLELASRPVQQGISNIFTNLREPITIVSNLLLGDTASASTATSRFLLNTTAGLGGYYDVATQEGIQYSPRTLEEVLCRYGVPAGPYVVLPVLGPATIRDATGRITTLLILWVALGPVYIPYRLADIAVQYVEVREQIRFIENMSVDSYAAQRSAHMQIHNKLACDGQTAHIQLFGQ